MKFWQSLAWAEVDQLTGIAKSAEEAGFHGVLNADHLFLKRTLNSKYPYTASGEMNYEPVYPFPDVWTSIAAMAAVTTRLHFSSSVYVLPLRNPIDVAKMASTAALLSNNRVALGFGVGWQKDEFDAMHVDFHTRGKRTDEMIDVLRKIWSGGVVSHHGRFFDFDDIFMYPAPTQPIPLYYGGTSAAALRRAATLCDGFISPPSTLEEASGLMAEIRALRREAGREHAPFEAIVPIRTGQDLPDLDTIRRLEDGGVTSIVAPPFHQRGATGERSTSGLPLRSTIDEKRNVLARYAEEVIAKVAA
jgi:probable F420-dependent oxidoreductase